MPSKLIKNWCHTIGYQCISSCYQVTLLQIVATFFMMFCCKKQLLQEHVGSIRVTMVFKALRPFRCQPLDHEFHRSLCFEVFIITPTIFIVRFWVGGGGK